MNILNITIFSLVLLVSLIWDYIYYLILTDPDISLPRFMRHMIDFMVKNYYFIFPILIFLISVLVPFNWGNLNILIPIIISIISFIIMWVYIYIGVNDPNNPKELALLSFFVSLIQTVGLGYGIFKSF